ncbi:hypothetical protein COW36_04975 [bacterium (Candidatus Blackallbacteria) CG17_big_fil_post_rev_8_21_14_2_50_48_46]|uniref:Uncharacterized protein n=1 Tax=bacterium (Candidatus Blackallbacteria) CG17_big_fil_post_rev_8_21_14_2_50_48_46 TaxID=2014261 RepID=A0A2M7G966_9BACT|nr:MAG: hypothetical protein COW64_03970 [bacterium (Candidatus Blackallbacteria) CG18_big_fil_WC_8_21_14_2_50_49_26]PIW18649.1 MAG: hypothetical protein COW36_04975 [bacterium (Candidatus Blackallbacteria) CG17_big_fil_post_rev_8_21_14_2_50_48_46]PIW46365.1 MAG: hypothetical protein COW20_15705 [bacterium (Candidatus Blackallbacteria) CG13_big_fil_rev_8_21_14_2_50_49_14]
MDAITRPQFKALFQLQFKLLQRAWKNPSTLQKAGVIITLIISTLMAGSLGWVMGYLVVILSQFSQVGSLQALMVQTLLLFMLSLFSLIWLLSPLLFALQNENLHLDLHKLLVYPLSFKNLYVLHTLTGFLEPWSLFFYPMVLGLIVGGFLLEGFSVLAPLLILGLLFGSVHVVWSRLLVNLLSSVLANRRLRETATLVLLAGIILLAFFPAVISSAFENHPDWQNNLREPGYFLGFMGPLNYWLALSPPGMATLALTGGLEHNLLKTGTALSGLFLWLLLGNQLGTSLLKQMVTSESGSRDQAQVSFAWKKSHLLGFLGYPLALIVRKELRSLSRSVIGKLCFFLTPFLLILMRLLLISTSQAPLPATTVCLSAMAYIFMTSLFLFCNLFGLDGEGFKLYLSGPMPVRRLLKGKHLAMACFTGSGFLGVLYLYTVFYEPIPLETLLFLALAFSCVILGALPLGTIISIRFPMPLDLNQTRYRQNATPVLLAFQMLSILLALPALAQGLGKWTHQPRNLVMFAILGIMIFCYFQLLRLSEELFTEHKLEILEKITQPVMS